MLSRVCERACTMGSRAPRLGLLESVRGKGVSSTPVRNDVPKGDSLKGMELFVAFRCELHRLFGSQKSSRGAGSA